MTEPTKDQGSVEEQSSTPTPRRKAARRKTSKKPDSRSDQNPVAEGDLVSSDQEPVAKVAEATAPKKRARRTTAKPAMVRLHNQLGQLLEVSVVNDNGLHEQVRLGAYAQSEPMKETNLTDYTRRLISRGYLRVASSTT